MNHQTPANPSEACGQKPDRRPPIVWVVSGYRAGERTQMLALAEALGWPYETKILGHRPWDFVPGLLRLSSVAGVDPRSRADLHPPWPDLIISAGMRNEPVARWIRQRAGKHCRLVHVGRPWAGYENFDLVITTPQYRLPERDNILQNIGTMHLIAEETMAAAAERWRPEFGNLPRPFLGVLIGGNSGPYTFGPSAAVRLAEQASRMAAQSGGSLLITTSSRTPAAATNVLSGALSCPHYLYQWTPDPASNPYDGILALAEQLIVTSDSVSMLSEAVGTGKPVHIFDLSEGDEQDFRWGAAFYRLLMRYGHRRLTRDLSLFHRQLTGSGRAAWLGEAVTEWQAAPLGDLDRAVARVRCLVDGRNRNSP